MNKAISAAAAIMMCAAAFAREANMRVVKSEPLRQAEMSERWTPFSLNIITPVGIPCFGFDWDVRGLEIGLGNYHPVFDGWQIGLVNVADDFRGLQLGVVNYSHKMYGVQIGVVNVIEDNDIPFLPIINWYF